MNVIPGDDILHARGHGGTDGEDKALFEGPAQQAQHTVPLRAVREVGHAVCSWVSNTGVWVLWLWAIKRRIGISLEGTTAFKTVMHLLASVTTIILLYSKNLNLKCIIQEASGSQNKRFSVFNCFLTSFVSSITKNCEH